MHAYMRVTLVVVIVAHLIPGTYARTCMRICSRIYIHRVVPQLFLCLLLQLHAMRNARQIYKLFCKSPRTYVCSCVCIYPCKYLCAHVLLYVRPDVLLYVCIYSVYMYVLLYVRLYVLLYACIYSVCMYVCTPVCIY